MDFGIKDAVETFLKWLDAHFSFRYFFMFSILFAAFLFAINPLLALLSLPPVPPMWRVISATGFLVCSSGSVLFGFERGLRKVHGWRTRRTHENAIKEHLYRLPQDQIAILSQYGETDKGSLMLAPSNGAVCELLRRGILYMPSNMGRYDGLFAYNPTPIAAKYLRRREFQRILLNQRSD